MSKPRAGEIKIVSRQASGTCERAGKNAIKLTRILQASIAKTTKTNTTKTTSGADFSTTKTNKRVPIADLVKVN